MRMTIRDCLMNFELGAGRARSALIQHGSQHLDHLGLDLSNEKDMIYVAVKAQQNSIPVTQVIEKARYNATRDVFVSVYESVKVSFSGVAQVNQAMTVWADLPNHGFPTEKKEQVTAWANQVGAAIVALYQSMTAVHEKLQKRDSPQPTQEELKDQLTQFEHVRVDALRYVGAMEGLVRLFKTDPSTATA